MAEEKTKDLAADRAKADVAASHQRGASEAASSVAEAVKRVADAAVAEVQKASVKGPEGDFIVTGTPGGRLRIRGNNNLGSSGTVKLNGTQVPTTLWGTSEIEGTLPAGAVSGEVVVALDSKTERRAYLKL